MTRVTANVSASLDGFVCGPNDSRENPLGDGGERRHEWVYDLASWLGIHGIDGGETSRDDEIFAESIDNVGAAARGVRPNDARRTRDRVLRPRIRRRTRERRDQRTRP